MSRQLPARPNLDHLRTQAKALLAKYRAGDSEAIQLLIDHLPEARKLSARQAKQRGFRLADAQAAIARKTGFAAWPGLARHVERLRSMEGKWAFQSLEIEGQKMPAGMLGASCLLIDGDRFRMESPEADYDGTFQIDVEQTPHHIDIDFVEGPEAGNRCEGLFELDGDRVRFCLALGGAKRPAAFVTSPGSGHALEELTRLEKSRPAGVDGGTPQPASAPAAVPDGAGFDAPLTALHEKLQGEWSALEVVNSGVPLQKTFLPYGSRTQTGTETKVVFGGQTMLHVRTRFDETASPVQVDYLHLSGAAAGAISLGIFRWVGEHAEFCVGAPGADRPTDFASDAGSGRTLSRWRRG
jgi:uncharacterized protein (TIGR03067 family)